jgi:hypothetical protein
VNRPAQTALNMVYHESLRGLSRKLDREDKQA